jgi:diadenosine tetraphosphate (Ap4A) HIT family hydrolase
MQNKRIQDKNQLHQCIGPKEVIAHFHSLPEQHFKNVMTGK